MITVLPGKTEIPEGIIYKEKCINQYYCSNKGFQRQISSNATL